MREQVYDDRISPLMEQIIEICKAENIPFYATFELDCEDEQDNFCTSCVIPEDASHRMQGFRRIGQGDPFPQHFALTVTTTEQP